MTPTPTILIIDDEADSRSLLKDILAPEGYRVRSADSGALALAALANWLPDLVLMDIRMPRMDGFEVYRRIRDHAKLRNVPVMFISAASEVEERVKGLALGAVDYISKPFQREELLARVRTHVELGRLRTELENQVLERTSELRNTVDRLRESEVRFRNLADTAPVMMWVSGTDKLCTFVNKTWLTFTGRKFEEEQGTGWTASVHPDDLDGCYAIYSASFDAREQFQMEYRLRRADGEYRWVLDKGTPRFAPGGSFAGYIGSAIDITDLKRSQEEALSRQKLQSLIALTRGIAHDFNNMVGAILAQAELAETGLTEGSEPADGVRQIKAVAIRASEIVRELMIYSGEEAVALEPVDLSDLIEEMSELLKTSISKKALLELDLCKDLPRVQGNATQMRQLVMNLIINASQAIGESGGSIHIQTSFSLGGAHSRSANAANFQDGHVRLQVSDTGCGMTEEQKAKIFDPFFTTKAQGHGLGLAVVQGIVHSHGGVINVRSAPGMGTTFEVLFRRAGGQSKSVPIPTSAGTSQRLTRVSGTVLLVEDEDPLRNATATALRKRGFTVLTAADGHAAVDIFRDRAGEIGVVLLDVTLPGLSGQEVYREIRAITPEVKVIFTSGHTGRIVEAALSDQALAGFLQKPYTISDLIRRLHEALSECKRTSITAVDTSGRSAIGGGRIGATTPLTDFMARSGEQANRLFAKMVEALPVAVYTTDAEGRLKYFNAAAVKLSGRVPELGTDRWCVTWKLFLPDGTPLPHEQCPMAVALNGGEVPIGVECIAERPDGTRFWFTPYPVIVRDAQGRITGCMNLLVDITDRKNAEIKTVDMLRQMRLVADAAMTQ